MLLREPSLGDGGYCTAIPISSSVPAGDMGLLVPSCHRAPHKLRHCLNHQTWSIAASQTSVLRETGKSQWRQTTNSISKNANLSKRSHIPLPSNCWAVPTLSGKHFHVHPSCLGCVLQYRSEDALWMGLAIWELVHIFLGTLWGNLFFKNFKQWWAAFFYY